MKSDLVTKIELVQELMRKELRYRRNKCFLLRLENGDLRLISPFAAVDIKLDDPRYREFDKLFPPTIQRQQG